MTAHYLVKEWYFCQQESELIFCKENQRLYVSFDHLESSVMINFIRHTGEVISKTTKRLQQQAIDLLAHLSSSQVISALNICSTNIKH
ncbi:MAG: hypothetical protein HRT38_15095 [Alteromonadaceae bacterium]|nr:hypothetical protein [Alteromonadaceae bacterium]